MKRILLTILIASCILSITPAFAQGDAATQQESPRKKFMYIGVGYGYCTGGWYSHNDSPFGDNWFDNLSYNEEEGSYYHFAFGFFLNEYFRAGLDADLYRVSSRNNAILYFIESLNYEDDRTFITILSKNFMGTITWFPTGDGFFLKTGFGYSRLGARREIFYEATSSDDSRTVTYRGFVVHLATGYLFSITNCLPSHFGINVIYTYNKYFTHDRLPFDSAQVAAHPVLGERPDNSHLWCVSLSLYFF